MILEILRGVSGCGKSTYAEARAKTGAVVVSRDALRKALFGSDDQDYYQVDKDVLRSKEDFISVVEKNAIVAALKAGKDVISDNTNIQPKYIKPIAEIGWKAGAEVKIKTFDVPLKVAVGRNQMRGLGGGRKVPEKVIKDQHQALQGTLDFKLEQPAPLRPYTGTPGKPKAILVDIDGTLAHMKNHRGPFDWKRVGVDEPDLNVMQVIRWIKSGMRADTLSWEPQPKVILMSGRDEVCREETILWTHAWDFGSFDELYMRPQGDMRKDSIVKAELFDEHIRDNYDVVMVFDDRNQVVDMWRSMGIQVAQVAEGDF